MAHEDEYPYRDEFLEEMRELLGQAKVWMKEGVEVAEPRRLLERECVGLSRHQRDAEHVDVGAVVDQAGDRRIHGEG